MKHYVYKTFNSEGEYYIGRHSTNNIEDGYLGSGKWVSSYKNKAELKKEILEYADDFESLLELEERYISKYINDEKNKNYSNKAKGFSVGKLNPSKKGMIPWNKGKKCPQISESLKKSNYKPTPETREKYKQNALKNWKNGVYDNRPPLSDETKKKISEAGKGRKQTKYQKERAREANLGKTVSSETREKLRQLAIKENKKIVHCPHCGKSGKGVIMRRWHFQNCKYYK